MTQEEKVPLANELSKMCVIINRVINVKTVLKQLSRKGVRLAKTLTLCNSHKMHTAMIGRYRQENLKNRILS